MTTLAELKQQKLFGKAFERTRSLMGAATQPETPERLIREHRRNEQRRGPERDIEFERHVLEVLPQFEEKAAQRILRTAAGLKGLKAHPEVPNEALAPIGRTPTHTVLFNLNKYGASFHVYSGELPAGSLHVDRKGVISFQRTRKSPADRATERLIVSLGRSLAGRGGKPPAGLEEWRVGSV